MYNSLILFTKLCYSIFELLFLINIRHFYIDEILYHINYVYSIISLIIIVKGVQTSGNAHQRNVRIQQKVCRK